MSEFSDSTEWKQGPQTSHARQRASEAATKHGGAAMVRAMYGHIKFRESHIDMINRAMIALEADEAAAIEFLRGASYVLVLRFLAAAQNGDELPSESIIKRLKTATGLYETFDRALKALRAADDQVIDYEDLLNDHD